MPSFLGSLFGSKPSVPDLPVVSLAQQQQNALTANQNALPGSQNLASSVNKFNIGQITQAIESVTPGFQAMTGQASSNIAAGLRGELSLSDQQMQQNRSVAGAFGAGIGGSGGMGAMVARDLGLTEYGIQQQALGSLESWTKMADQLFAPGMMNVTSMFVTPEQMYQAQNEQNMQQFQRQWMQNQISAMPDPVMAGIHNTIMQLAGDAAGAMGGGGGGQGLAPQSYPGFGGGSPMYQAGGSQFGTDAMMNGPSWGSGGGLGDWGYGERI